VTAADKAQRKHDVPDALVQRLNALIEGSDDWHEWHQAGVLLFELARSLHLQLGTTDSWHDQILDMLDIIDWMYDTALGLVPESDVVAACAVKSDQELTLSFERYIRGLYANSERFYKFEAIVRKLEDIDTPESRHQLAITYGLMARAAWWMTLSDPSHGVMVEKAAAWEALATEHFRNNPLPADRQQAYRSHLLAMALIHSQKFTRGWRQKYTGRAFWLALCHRDFKHAARAIVIDYNGSDGEKWLLSRRDTPELAMKVFVLMERLWIHRRG